MDVSSEDKSMTQLVQVNLSTIALPVLAANDQEMLAHDGVLQQIDKSSGGKTLWRQLAI
jgi:DNA polymerase-3 subunit epsilon